ncbi:hypothetical protein WJX72_001678 [[Myrmecia] bisecta]|uniref:Twin-arginine translocase subunit TatB n=1 Tax=[Myrmecia] bisecta TaxID=41462 RepID=A0AAW1QEB2_9CHLO
MVLGLGYGELLVYLVVAAVVIGPKDLPKVARAAGRLTGQAASYVSTARSRMLTFAEETELTKLHQEMQESMHQLQAIRAELRSGVNLMNPGGP